METISGVPRQHRQIVAEGTAWRDVHGVAPRVQREHLAGRRPATRVLDTAEMGSGFAAVPICVSGALQPVARRVRQYIWWM